MNLTKDDFTSQIKEVLSRLKVKKLSASNGRQSIVRCPYCGDSRNKGHHHLYIKLEMPSFFFCQICGTAGLTDKALFSDLNLYDADLYNMLDEVNKDFARDQKKVITVRKNQGVSQNPLVKGSKANKSAKNKGNDVGVVDIPDEGFVIPTYDFSHPDLQSKIKYLEGRLGVRVDQNFCRKYKVILDSDYFFAINNITAYTQKDQVLDDLREMYIGFLSSDSNFITFRCVENVKGLSRYYDYNITGIPDNRGKFYTSANLLDCMTEKLTINMAEGILSAIGGNEYLGRYDRSTIVCAANGKGFKSIVNQFVKLGFLSIQLNFFIDEDVDNSMVEELFEHNYLTNNIDFKLSIFRNTLKEDFGYPKSEIHVAAIEQRRENERTGTTSIAERIARRADRGLHSTTRQRERRD